MRRWLWDMVSKPRRFPALPVEVERTPDEHACFLCNDRNWRSEPVVINPVTCQWIHKRCAARVV